MPTIIIHELHKQPRAQSFAQNKIVIGREDGCDIVLTHTSVSRQHAQIFLASDHNYYVQMISQKNPILANGKIISEHTSLKEGDELQFGPYLIYFSKEDKAMPKYMQQKTHLYEAECRGCGWQGTLSEHTRNPICPRCGLSEFNKAEDMFSNPMANERTSTLDAAALARLHQSTKAAKTARIERVVAIPGKPSKINLTESTVVVIGGSDSDLPFKGLRIGGTATISWSGTNFIVQSEGFMPKLKINGNVREKATLKNGDVLQMGGTEFKFLIG
tara:strand:+ start:7528 stop:8346 length:819 start_codon:yes stop_codon:yes gene_type:complete